MGLDVAFSRQRALEAGMTLTVSTRGRPEEIKKAEADKLTDPDYLEYLRQEAELVNIPNTVLIADNNSGSRDHIIVRANKWGRIYTPLTVWLAANGIEWSEF
jgi:hypothetical protein